jgi:Protein of unknown function (DUF1501)
MGVVKAFDLFSGLHLRPVAGGDAGGLRVPRRASPGYHDTIALSGRGRGAGRDPVKGAVMGPMHAHRHRWGLSRREMLRAGGLGLFGLGLDDVLRGPGRAGGAGGRPRSVILAFCPGAPSHIDTWDPKPDAPAQIRGEFATIAARTPGLRVSEHLPGLAALSDRFSLVRSMTHGEREHEPGSHAMLAGLPKAPPNATARANRATDWPNLGSVLAFARPGPTDLPASVALPTKLTFGGYSFPGQDAGFLGPQYDPWHLEGDPNAPGFRPPSLGLPEGLSLSRLGTRDDLLAEVDSRRRDLDRVGEVARFDGFRRKAVALLASGRTRDAFDLDREDPRLRDRYGRHLMGQGLLLARRLVEAGVGLVQVNLGVMNHWDTHSDNFTRLKDTLLPPFDRGVSALIEDLHARGLADDVLLIVTGEFGRTPRVGQRTTVANATSTGRDHWGGVFTALVCGGGTRPGLVVGASDKIGAYPAAAGYTPADLAATVYRQVGIDPSREVRDMLGRTFRLNSGTPIAPLLG